MKTRFILKEIMFGFLLIFPWLIITLPQYLNIQVIYNGIRLALDLSGKHFTEQALLIPKFCVRIYGRYIHT